MIGEKSYWGRGIGRKVTTFCVKHGFSTLNLNRIQLTVLADNRRAIELYRSVGFVDEGVMRQAQYKDGVYKDVMLMSILQQDGSLPGEGSSRE